MRCKRKEKTRDERPETRDQRAAGDAFLQSLISRLSSLSAVSSRHADDMITAILLNILLPILVMIALGAWLRWKFSIDLNTLTKLNIYLFVPAFVFQKVATSKLPWIDMAGVVMITLIQVATLGIIVWGIGRLLRVGRKTLAAVALAVMFYNSGNYGLPLAQLAYPGHADRPLAVTQNSGLRTRLKETAGRCRRSWSWCKTCSRSHWD